MPRSREEARGGFHCALVENFFFPPSNPNFAVFADVVIYSVKTKSNSRHGDSGSLLRRCLGLPERIQSSEVGKDTENLLDEVQVFGLNGKGIPISDLWKDRKAVVAFARHFGCVLCRKRADYLAAKKDVMDASNVALVLIGPGSVDQARVFAEQTKFQGEVYADPSHSSYEALRFVSGVSTTFTPKAGLKIIQSYMEGYRQDWKLSSERDTVRRGGWQQGGILVAGPGKGNISYIHRDKEAGDDPDIEDILKACCT
ncbi:hypothetical protein SLE2022_076530 [Rubroshorea leprosula]